MSNTFSTNVFIRGAAAFYGVTPSEQDVYQLKLKFCRLNSNPPPETLRIRRTEEGSWVCMDYIADEFTFIAKEIGKKIQGPLARYSF